MLKFTWIIIIAVPVIFAIVCHEVAHGYVAYRFGDPTAKLKGRLSLNPIVHIDLVGTIIIPAFLILTKAGILFGWAKPVPVNFSNLRNPKKHMVFVSLAGPMTNFLLASLSLIGIRIIYSIQPDVFYITHTAAQQVSQTSLTFILTPLARMLPIALIANIALGLLNLIPIPPLDGGRILTGILPNHLARRYARIEPFGILILVLLIFSGAFRYFEYLLGLIIFTMSYVSSLPIIQILSHLLNTIDAVFS